MITVLQQDPDVLAIDQLRSISSTVSYSNACNNGKLHSSYCPLSSSYIADIE
jgi:hypothetical protein